MTTITIKMTTITIKKEWYNEIKGLVKMENEFFYTEAETEFVEVDVDFIRFVQVSRELGWMY